MCTNAYCSTIPNVQIWIDHKCPSTLDWINKARYFHKIKYYTETGRNKILVHHQQG